MSMEAWLELYGEGLRRGASTWVTKNTLTKAGWEISATEALEELKEAGIAEPVGARGTREYFQVKAIPASRGGNASEGSQSELLARVKRLEARVDQLERLMSSKKAPAELSAQVKGQAQTEPDDDEEPPF